MFVGDGSSSESETSQRWNELSPKGAERIARGGSPNGTQRPEVNATLNPRRSGGARYTFTIKIDHRIPRPIFSELPGTLPGMNNDDDVLPDVLYNV